MCWSERGSCDIVSEDNGSVLKLVIGTCCGLVVLVALALVALVAISKRRYVVIH
mgnify:CR=1 FL=1